MSWFKPPKMEVFSDADHPRNYDPDKLHRALEIVSALERANFNGRDDLFLVIGSHIANLEERIANLEEKLTEVVRATTANVDRAPSLTPEGEAAFGKLEKEAEAWSKDNRP